MDGISMNPLDAWEADAKAGPGPCATCFAPLFDTSSRSGRFASIGYSDPLLGRKRAAWRTELAAEEAADVEGPNSPCAPKDIDAELARLLADDDDDVDEAAGPFPPCDARAAMPTSLMQAAREASAVPGTFAVDEPDILPLLGDDNATCTTCWNLNAALAERKARGQYSLPETAMGLGSSKMMSTEERAFVDGLMDGRCEDRPLEGVSRIAARLGGLTSPDSGAASDSSTARLGAGSRGSASDGPVSVVSVGGASPRPAKRAAEETDAEAEQAKRPRRAAASRAAELARMALQDEADDAREPASSSSASASAAASAARHSPAPLAPAPCRASRPASAPKGRQLPEWSVHVLKEWLLSPEHFDFPWPTPEEKEDLAARAGVDERQLGIWLTNARKRLWMPLRRRQGLPIPRYADAKADRVQRALVERVEREATRRPAGAGPAEAPAPADAPAQVDSVGAIRVSAALAAAHEQLRSDAAALEAEAAAVAERAAALEAALAAPRPAPAAPAAPFFEPPRLVPVFSPAAGLPVAMAPPASDWDLAFGLGDDDDYALGLA